MLDQTRLRGSCSAWCVLAHRLTLCASVVSMGVEWEMEVTSDMGHLHALSCSVSLALSSVHRRHHTAPQTVVRSCAGAVVGGKGTRCCVWHNWPRRTLSTLLRLPSAVPFKCTSADVDIRLVAPASCSAATRDTRGCPCALTGDTCCVAQGWSDHSQAVGTLPQTCWIRVRTEGCRDP